MSTVRQLEETDLAVIFAIPVSPTLIASSSSSSGLARRSSIYLASTDIPDFRIARDLICSAIDSSSANWRCVKSRSPTSTNGCRATDASEYVPTFPCSILRIINGFALNASMNAEAVGSNGRNVIIVASNISFANIVSIC